MPDCESICATCHELLHEEDGTACREGECLNDVIEGENGVFYHDRCEPVDACHQYSLTQM